MTDNQPSKRLFNRAVCAAVSSHLASKSPFLIEKEKNKKLDQAKKREEKHKGYNCLLTQEMNDFLRVIDEKKKRSPLKHNFHNNGEHSGNHQELIERSKPTMKSWNRPKNWKPNFDNDKMNDINSKNLNLNGFTNFAGNRECNKYGKSAHYDFTPENSISISKNVPCSEKSFDWDLNSEPESESSSSCSELNSFTDYSLPVFALSYKSNDATQSESKVLSREFSSQNVEMPCDFKMSSKDFEFKKNEFTRGNSTSIASRVACYEENVDWELNSGSESSSSCSGLISLTNFFHPVSPLYCKSNDVKQLESNAFFEDFSSQNLKTSSLPSISKNIHPIPSNFVSQSSLYNDTKIRNQNQLMQDCMLPSSVFNKYENDRIQNLIDEFL